MVLLSVTKAILVAYVIIGLLLNVILFFYAKIRNLNEEHEEWAFVLQSIFGLFYFLFLGSILWLPVFISYIAQQKRRYGKFGIWTVRYMKLFLRRQKI